MTPRAIISLRLPYFAAFALFLCGFTLHAGAQARGSIAGTVSDPNGALLQGAVITIQTPSLSASTNEAGRYYINDLAPGSYTLTVSYFGLTELSSVVIVRAGETATLDAHLQIPSQKQSVIVTAARASAEAEALNVERASDNLVQVMPNQIITSLPNANLADALGRMPSVTLERDEGEGKYVQVRSTEPRLTNTTVDGINLPSEEPGVRQIKFDAIPASLVDSVQVSKTLQANMEGDGIGGSVNLVTRLASDTPTVEITGLGGYTPIANGRGNTTETATLGRRFGAGKKFGLIGGASYDWEGRGIDDIEPVPDINNGQTWFDAMDIREYLYFRSRYGLSGSADYRIRDGSTIFARFLYSNFLNAGNRYAYSLTDGDVPSFNTQLRHPRIQVGSLILSGNHVFDRTWYTWELNVGRASYGDVPSETASFDTSLASSNCHFDPGATNDKYLPQWAPVCYTEAFDTGSYTLSKIRRSLGTAAQLNLGVGGTGAARYHLGKRSAIFEYGGKFRNEHKYANTYELTLTPTVSVPMAAFPNRLVYKHFYNGGKYPLGYNPNAEDVISYASAHSSAFTSESTQGIDPSQFGIVEQVSAGYVMNTIDFSNGIRFIAGLRAENTADGVHNLAFGDSGNPTPNSYSGSYYTLLPSASVRFNAGADSYVRLIYARGLSRPDPQDIAQPLSWSVACNGSHPFCVTFGNANLKAETGDDVDVLYDHYFKQFGMISAGYFYKKLHDPIVYTNTALDNYLPPGAPASDRGNYLATQPVNAGSAWLSGFEASYLQHYTSLPGFLGGLGLSGNYSYIGSRTSGIPGRSDNPRLLRNSPNMFNLSPTFDRGRYSARLGLSYNQASIYGYQYSDGTQFGVKGPFGDIYFYSHMQVDAQGSVGLRHGLSVIVSGLNLNNEVFGFYQGSPQYMIQREYYQPTISFGMRWSPSRE
jgi:TonB-dependent receptor